MKIVYLFPGYGSQFVGMAKELYDEYRVVQEYFEEASNCLKDNFVKLCFASSDAELGRMENAYVALFLVSSAIAQLLKEKGIMPDALSGRNQGEFTAFSFAGGMSFPDGLYLLSKYASIYSEALKDMDAQLERVEGLAADTIKHLCDEIRGTDGRGGPFVAVYVDPTTHIIAGTNDAIARFRAQVEQMDGVKLSGADPEIGMHSPLMEDVYVAFKPYMEKVDCKELSIPFICRPDQGCIVSCEAVKLCIASHLVTPVYWSQARRDLADYDCIVQIGPGTHLSDEVAKIYPDKIVMAINTKADVEALEALVLPKKENNEDEEDGGIQ